MVTERRGVDGQLRLQWAWLAPAVMAAGAIATMVVALLVGGGAPRPAPPGLPDPGPLTGWGLPVSRLAMDVAAVATTGALLFAVLAPARGGKLGDRAVRVVRLASAWAWAWAAAAALTLMFTLSDFLGQPVHQVQPQETLAGFVFQVSQGRALAVVVLAAVVLAATAREVRSLNGAGLLLVLTIGTVLPPPLTGHSADAANHDIATSSLILHVVAVTLWVGGLVGLIAFDRSAPTLRAIAPRFSTLAVWCFAAAALSGVVNALVRLGGLAEAVTTSYGWLVLGKTVALVVLGWFGWRHRQMTLPALERGDAGAFRRFAVTEVAVMLATIGLAVALSRTPTPVPEEIVGASRIEAVLGYPLPPFSVGRLFTEWRPDVLILGAAAFGIVAYLRGVRRLRRNGVAWPHGRTVAWLAGIIVAVFVLCSGAAAYGRAMFSVHMVQHMALTMLIPILLATGAPVTLALRALPTRRRTARPQDRPREADRFGAEGITPDSTAAGDTATGDTAGETSAADADVRRLREWILVVVHSRVARVATHPLVALAFYVVSLYAFYFSWAFELALRSHTGHLLMIVHFLMAGYLYFWVILGLDPTPRRLPALARLGVLFASLPFHAFFGVIVMTSTTLFAADWYNALALPWVDPLADQNVGGGIAWATTEIPTLLVIGVVFAEWVRADKREARRFDRRVDAGTDEELTRYNAMLSQLAKHDHERPS